MPKGEIRRFLPAGAATGTGKAIHQNRETGLREQAIRLKEQGLKRSQIPNLRPGVVK